MIGRPHLTVLLSALLLSSAWGQAGTFHHTLPNRAPSMTSEPSLNLALAPVFARETGMDSSLTQFHKPSQTAGMDALVIKFARYDTFFWDVIDNASTHSEHQLKFKIRF